MRWRAVVRGGAVLGATAMLLLGAASARPPTSGTGLERLTLRVGRARLPVSAVLHDGRPEPAPAGRSRAVERSALHGDHGAGGSVGGHVARALRRRRTRVSRLPIELNVCRCRRLVRVAARLQLARTYGDPDADRGAVGRRALAYHPGPIAQRRTDLDLVYVDDFVHGGRGLRRCRRTRGRTRPERHALVPHPASRGARHDRLRAELDQLHGTRLMRRRRLGPAAAVGQGQAQGGVSALVGVA
jgi:hypothetical protein